MDKKYEISTLIRRDHKFGENAYVRGRVTGMQAAICSQDREYANVMLEEGIVLTAKCTAIQYDNFMNLVESKYPGLCKFDYKES